MSTKPIDTVEPVEPDIPVEPEKSVYKIQIGRAHV